MSSLARALVRRVQLTMWNEAGSKNRSTHGVLSALTGATTNFGGATTTFGGVDGYWEIMYSMMSAGTTVMTNNPMLLVTARCWGGVPAGTL